MKTKSFKHEKIESCSLCEKIIDTGKDNWVAVIDFKGEDYQGVKFYHRFCLTDLIKGQGRIIAQNFQEKVQKMTGGILKNIKSMVDNSGTDKKVEFYEIKN